MRACKIQAPQRALSPLYAYTYRHTCTQHHGISYSPSGFGVPFLQSTTVVHPQPLFSLSTRLCKQEPPWGKYRHSYRDLNFTPRRISQFTVFLNGFCSPTVTMHHHLPCALQRGAQKVDQLLLLHTVTVINTPDKQRFLQLRHRQLGHICLTDGVLLGGLIYLRKCLQECVGVH